jgi:hypothetical protein
MKISAESRGAPIRSQHWKAEAGGCDANLGYTARTCLKKEKSSLEILIETEREKERKS